MGQPAEVYQWGLLLPICYRPTADPAADLQGSNQMDGGVHFEGDARSAVWGRLQRFVTSLRCTTSQEDRALLRVHIGIDQVSACITQ